MNTNVNFLENTQKEIENIFNKAINDTWKFCFSDINKANHRSNEKTNLYHKAIGSYLNYSLNATVDDFSKNFKICTETDGLRIPIIDSSGEKHAVDGAIFDLNNNPVFIISAKFPLMCINKNRNNLFESKNGLVNRLLRNPNNGIKGILFVDFVPNRTLTSKYGSYVVENVNHKGFNTIEKNGSLSLVESSFPDYSNNIHEITINYDINIDLNAIKNKEQLIDTISQQNDLATVSSIVGANRFIDNFMAVVESNNLQNSISYIQQQVTDIKKMLLNISLKLDAKLF